MAVVMSLEWPGVTVGDYDRAMGALGLDAEPPAGGLFHVCGAEGGALHIFDIWESEDAWNSFRDGRLMPTLQELGLMEKGQPNVRVYTVHNIFAPTPDDLSRLGASSSLAGSTA
jgi:hypothetical protein